MRDQLVAAMVAGVNDKGKSLGTILLDQKAIADDTRALLRSARAKAPGPASRRSQQKSGGDQFFRGDQTRVEARHGSGSAGQPGPGTGFPARRYRSLCHAAEPTDHPAGHYAPDAPFCQTAPNPGLRFRILRPHARGGLGEDFSMGAQCLSPPEGNVAGQCRMPLPTTR